MVDRKDEEEGAPTFLSLKRKKLIYNGVECELI
jgi:hypothetical protein